MATILAQPILQPSLFYLGISLQVSHSSPRMIPIPQEEEASTKNLMRDMEDGLDNEEPQKLVDSWAPCYSEGQNCSNVFSLPTNYSISQQPVTLGP